MSLPWYLAGGFALASVALGAWSGYQAKVIEGKQTTIEARDATIATLTKDVAQAKVTNTENVTEIEDLKADLTRYAELAVRYRADADARARLLNKTIEEIARGPADEDGPVAVVLERQLDRMRGRTAGAGGADQGQGRAGHNP